MLNHRRPVVMESMENRVLFDASLLTETIVSSTLPALVSDHAALKGNVVVMIANNSDVLEKEKVVTGIAFTDGTLNPLIPDYFKSEKLTLSLKIGQVKTIKFSINVAKGKLADGVDTIYGLTVNTLGAYTETAAGPTVTVHAPIVTFSETETFTKLTDTVVSGAKLKPGVKVAITNTGTDPSTDPINIAVYATSDGVAADGTAIALLSNKKVTINPGKTATVSLALSTVSALTAGSYTIITQVTQTNGTITTTDPATAPAVTISTTAGGGGTTATGPLFSDSIVTATPSYEPDPLEGFLQTISELKLNMSITNNGLTIGGTDTLALFASTSSTFDSTAVDVGQITLNLGSIVGSGGKRSFNADFNVASNFPGTADSDGNINDYVYVQITDSAGNVTMASDPTAINFAGPIVG